MAYAGIVGVPPIMGLYTIVPPLIAYALLGTSRLLVVGPDTATGLISALTVGAIAAQGTADFNTLTSTLAILIGAFFLLFGALRMGWVAAFIPTPVMRGFIEGLVCVTIIGQVPHLLGIDGTSGNFFTKLWFVLQHLPDASLAPVLTGLLSLLAMLLLRHLAPRVPAALVVAVAATILVGLFDGEAAGVKRGRRPPVRPASPRAAQPRPCDTVGPRAGRACHRAGRLCRGARRGKGRGNAGRRRNRSEPGADRAWARQHFKRPFRRLPRRRQPVQDLRRDGRRRPHPGRQPRRRGLLLPHAGSIDAVVPGHAAPGACRHRDRSNASPLEARLFARSVRPQPLGVCAWPRSSSPAS